MSDSAVVTRPLTVDDFIAFMEDRPKGERWFLDDGTPVMNPQPTRRHDWIQINIIVALRSHRERHRPGWRPAGPSQVPVPGLNRTVAPDVLVAPETDRDDVSITLDPIVVFEVLSKSDKAARRTQKLADYESIASIQHYVVVRQDQRAVTAYRRDSGGRFVIDPPGDVIELSAIGVSLTVETIYAETALG